MGDMTRGPDGYRYDTEGADAEAQARLDRVAEEILKQRQAWDLKPKSLPAAKAILDDAPEAQLEILLALNRRLRKRFALKNGCRLFHDRLLQQLLRRKLPFTREALDELLQAARETSPSQSFLPWPLLAGVAERFVKAEGLPEDLRGQLIEISAWIDQHQTDAAVAKASQRLAKLAGLRRQPIVAGEPWADAAIADLEALAPELADGWADLIEHAAAATGARPGKRWRQLAARRLEKVGAGELERRLLAWFPRVDEPRTQPLVSAGYDDTYLLDDTNANILKGLVWCCADQRLAANRELARALSALALCAFRKVPMIGPRSVKVGNACVHALGEMGVEGVGQLAVLKARVKLRNVQKGIDKALHAAAERQGVSREDLEEMAVPAYGLHQVGRRTERLGDYQAELTVDGSSARLLWLKDDGKGSAKALKSVPRAVRDGFGDELKELRATAKDIQKMLAAQRDRLDQLHLRRKRWSYPVWKKRYLDHPLVGTLARRLIWRFLEGDGKVEGVWGGDGLVDVAGEPLAGLGDAVEVELWHPIGEPLERTSAWRGRLERLRIRQPFKQAHREVYLVTDAERQTGVYSNRFAAHVVKQHQFNALCAVRGWRNTLRLMVDDEFPPASRELPGWGLRAELWIDGAGDEYGVDTNDAGTFLYLVTDQVRFYPSEAPQHYAHASGGGYGAVGARRTEPMPIADVPALVFSEVMRDVDLFVGVASVGNDPTWQDGGPEARYRDYWQSYSFGELSATAQTRRELLEGLVPRLKIAGRCSFEDRFLVVRGELNRYKIHLGSGNILMAPGDRYLCIVPARGAASGPAAKVFLPFEGDRTLSIILSKAFMLAADTRIKDSAIVSQLGE